MAYSDDLVNSKLSTLQDTADSVPHVGAWLYFHRRFAENSVRLIHQRLPDSPPAKRIALISLLNELAQQSKARGKKEFVVAISPIIEEATVITWKGAPHYVQTKLRKTFDAWLDRKVFDMPVMEAIMARIPEFKPKKEDEQTTQKQPLGGSLFGSTPSELQSLVPLQVALTKAAMVSNTSTDTASTEYKRMNDPQSEQPPLPRQAAQLNQLLRTLTSAESSVSEVIKSRRALIDGLEKLLTTNRSELAKEETVSSELAEKKAQTDAKKREVEDAIVRGFDDTQDPDRPTVEALTPPPVEAITPVGSPKARPSQASHGPFMDEPEEPLPEEFSLSYSGQPDDGSAFPELGNLSPGGSNDFDLGANGSGAKRRKTTHGEDDYSQFAGGDLDEDVSALLASQGN
ncbi:NACHT nucleoside triphosphatase [Penicillium atrosanguineum]|uniref:CID domain-containing protein n=1 Tax=Penicillium atrosanguineum TaxID=1132637 RepID=A0A9W9PNP9_9EURO|nr:NACHT nucleoside triphosphatase [Penicillium atrosanguineum]KAJ5293135.1 NACHT nucleoside triphosphatase [Penicillium atrosanguineum]KAJ5302830.1 hypothetical protein N7476_009629 [Penicillium atrosanguineum]